MKTALFLVVVIAAFAYAQQADNSTPASGASPASEGDDSLLGVLGSGVKDMLNDGDTMLNNAGKETKNLLNDVLSHLGRRKRSVGDFVTGLGNDIQQMEQAASENIADTKEKFGKTVDAIISILKDSSSDQD